MGRFSHRESLREIADSRAVRELILCLQDEGLDKRAIISALGNIYDSRAIEVLLTALRDQDQNIRLEAVGGLKNICDSRAIGPLLSVLWNKGEDYHVREYAATAMGKIDGIHAVKELSTFVQDKNQDMYVRRAAAQALAETNYSEAIPGLIIALESKDGPTHSAAKRGLEEAVQNFNPIIVCDHFLIFWLQRRLNIETLTTLYELLLQVTPKLYMAVGRSWPIWRICLSIPKNQMLKLRWSQRYKRKLRLLGASIVYSFLHLSLLWRK